MSNNCSHDDYDLNLPFTLERHLNNFREHDTNAQKLTDSFHIIRDNMKQNLKSVIMMFPHYSDHSHEHSENIISSVERLLGRKRIEKLSPSDTWMLMVCAYMHDLGMLIQGKELENDWNSESFQNYLENCKDSSDDHLVFNRIVGLKSSFTLPAATFPTDSISQSRTARMTTMAATPKMMGRKLLHLGS